MGLIYSLQNVALLITPNLTVFIQKESNSYENVIMLYKLLNNFIKKTIIFLMFMNIFAFVYAVLYHFEHKKPNISTLSASFIKKLMFHKILIKRVCKFRRRCEKRRKNLRKKCFYLKFIDFYKKNRKLPLLFENARKS